MDWNFRNDQPIYSQLTQRLTEAIVSGIYAPGEKLPSVRELAVEAGERDGLVFSQRTAGRFVTENENMIANAKLRIADERVGEFLHSMKTLGCTRDEVIALIQGAKEEEE